MDSAAAHLSSSSPTEPHGLHAVVTPRLLPVVAQYTLTEAGRKASLLSGGDGRAQQVLELQLPTTRLHLVTVDAQGRARLKLAPRYELGEDQRVVRRNGPPAYDAPPSLDDLFRDAARNHELERLFRTERIALQHRRRDEDQDYRRTVAEAFFADHTQRALPHPIPTPTRCFVGTERGRVMFDTSSDVGRSRDLPAEAWRRFRRDLALKKEHNREERARQEALRAEKLKAIDAWVTAYGSEDQRARYAAGLLPEVEVIEALTDEAFACVADRPRYTMDGVGRLEAHLRQVTGRTDIIVAPADLVVTGSDADSATPAQWSVIESLHRALPDAKVILRAHRLSWRKEPALPALVVHGVLVTRRVGPFNLRREFAVLTPVG